MNTELRHVLELLIAALDTTEQQPKPQQLMLEQPSETVNPSKRRPGLLDRSHANCRKAWTDLELQAVQSLKSSGWNLQDIGTVLGRSRRAIQNATSAMNKLQANQS